MLTTFKEFFIILIRIYYGEKKYMEEDIKNYKYTLLVESENGEQIRYPCPNKSIKDIIKVLFLTQQKEIISPDEGIIQLLRELLGQPITEKMIAKWTGLSEKYLEQLLLGIIVPEETQKITALVEFLEKVRE